MLRTPEGFGLGWLPDYPDFRDHTTEHGSPPEGEQKDTPTLLHEVGVDKVAASAALGSSTSLRPYFSPIEDQSTLGSCTANAGVGMLEYFEMRAFGKHIDASRLFLYKATRNLMGVTGDTGAFLRTTMQSMVTFGIPPEQYWPYDVAAFEREPTAFCYSFAQDYRSLRYYRLDPPGTDPDELLARIQAEPRRRAAGDVRLHRLQLVRADEHERRCLPLPDAGRAPGGRTRGGRGRLR